MLDYKKINAGGAALILVALALVIFGLTQLSDDSGEPVAAGGGTPRDVDEQAVGLFQDKCGQCHTLAVAGTTVHGEGYTGWAQIVVDEERRTVVGATFVGADVAELLHSATTAVVGEVPLDRLWHAVPAYPTISEVWLRLLETLRG